MNGRTSVRSVDRVRDAARAAGLELQIVTMPQTTRTANDAARACGCAVGQIVKSLVFRLADSRAPVLILVSGDNRVDTGLAASQIGEALETMDANAVRAETGFAIGGVAPFGATTALKVYMDRDLFAHDIVWAAAGAPDCVFQTTPDALSQACRALTIAVSP